jgi:hypothetical protein
MIRKRFVLLIVCAVSEYLLSFTSRCCFVIDFLIDVVAVVVNIVVGALILLTSVDEEMLLLLML